MMLRLQEMRLNGQPPVAMVTGADIEMGGGSK